MKPFLLKVSAFILSLSMFLCLGFVAIILPATSEAFYENQFEKNDTLLKVQYQEKYLTGDAKEYIASLDKEGLIDLMLHAIRYCLSLEDNLNPTVDSKLLSVYTENELSHMQDVREVFSGGITIVLIAFVISVLILIFILRNKSDYYRHSRKYPIYSVIMVVALLAFVAVFAIVDFETAFVIFHLLLFDGNWQFANGVMIAMIGEIFFDIAFIIASLWAAFILLYVVFILILNALSKPKKQVTFK